MSWSDHRVRSSLGILEFRDLGQDYKDGFQRGVVPKGEIGHVRRHVTDGMASEDYKDPRKYWLRLGPNFGQFGVSWVDQNCQRMGSPGWTWYPTSPKMASDGWTSVPNL